MLDIKVRVLLSDGTRRLINAYTTRSNNLCIGPTDNKINWTIIYVNTGYGVGSFESFRATQYVVGVLISLQLDNINFLVRRKEWKRLTTVVPEVKKWLLEISK